MPEKITQLRVHLCLEDRQFLLSLKAQYPYQTNMDFALGHLIKAIRTAGPGETVEQIVKKIGK